MPSPDPGTATVAQIISRVRRMIRDQAVYVQDTFTGDGTKGQFAAGSSPFRLKRAPVWIGSTPICTVGGVNQPVSFDGAGNPGPGNLNIISDTGELLFGTVPGAAAVINIAYQAFRFSDLQIQDALTEGMRGLWPDIWQPVLDTTSVLFSPGNTEYTLPAVYNNPRVIILSVEAQPPNGIVVSVPTGAWRRQGLTTFVVLRNWPAGTTLRLTYNYPYSVLTDMEDEIVQIACYYACYRLLMDMETMRARSNDLVALTGEGGSAPETAAKTAQFWLARYDQARTRLAIRPAMRMDVPDRSVEKLEGGPGFSWNPL